VIPSTVVFVAYDADPGVLQLSLSDPDSCPMFDRWRCLRKSGITVDFQRILGFASYLSCFKDFVLDPSGFEEKSVIGRNIGVSTQIYLDHRSEGGWRRLNRGEGQTGGAEGRLFSVKTSA
jgi:hypothetical protein